MKGERSLRKFIYSALVALMLVVPLAGSASADDDYGDSCLTTTCDVTNYVLQPNGGIGSHCTAGANMPTHPNSIEVKGTGRVFCNETDPRINIKVWIFYSGWSNSFTDAIPVGYSTGTCGPCSTKTLTTTQAWQGKGWYWTLTTAWTQYGIPHNIGKHSDPAYFSG